MKRKCLLCSGEAALFEKIFQKEYYSCRRCRSVFLDPEYHLSLEDERLRYEQHNNDVNDPRYQRFVTPVIEAVERKFSKGHEGLDFGSGPGPVVTKLLRDRGFCVELYDPFFANCPERLKRQYDFIVCCEVIEHFRDPAVEFDLLRSLVRPGGALICMTELYTFQTDFSSWYYKNDPAHVFFYHQEALEWIRGKYYFSAVAVQGRLIEFCV